MAASLLVAAHHGQMTGAFREQWWTKKQAQWSGEVVLFPWQDYPRWPGIVVPPCAKSNLKNGKGIFYPPEAKVLDTAFKNAANGERHVQAREPGKQKVSKRNFRQLLQKGVF